MQCGTLTNQIFGLQLLFGLSPKPRRVYFIWWCELKQGVRVQKRPRLYHTVACYLQTRIQKNTPHSSEEQSTQRIHILQQFSSLQNADYSNAYIYSQTLLFKINNTVDIFTHILSQNYNPYNYFYRSHTPTVKSVDTIHHNWVIYPLTENPTKECKKTPNTTLNSTDKLTSAFPTTRKLWFHSSINE
jgi:hypothetical protein